MGGRRLPGGRREGTSCTVNCGKCGRENPAEARFCNDCGEPLGDHLADGATLIAPAHEPEVLFGRYQVLEELGRGGMGRVVRVLDTSIQEEVALKLIRSRFADVEATLERFRNELKLARRISHRNVCRMFDFGESEGTPYITMEYVRGESLRQILDRDKTVAPERVSEITRGVCRGLGEAHRLGVVHRDLKPQNVLIDEENEPRILDFGIARSSATSGLTEMGSMIGTAEYMSPEQASATEIDHRSDIYSLGIIIYEMLVGRPPFTGDTPFAVALKQINEPPPKVGDFGPEVPKRLAEIAVTCLQKKPEERFQEVREILVLLGDRVSTSATMAAATAEVPAFLRADAPQPEATAVAPFAARGAELRRLQELWDTALSGSGQVAFITGEPGSGKSTLAGEFARRAQEAEAELIVAAGRCDASPGGGGPYLPFRQILELLTGDVESRWTAGALDRERAARLWGLIPLSIAALVEYGPDLTGTLLRSKPLLQRAADCGGRGQKWFERLEQLIAERAGSHTAGLKEAEIQDQYARVLLSLARRRPLILILDDLQWVDSASANLLVQLGQQIAESPILIIGTSRSAELSLGREGERHPLATVVNELKRLFGEIEIALDRAEGRAFLNAYLDLNPNRFSGEFRDGLFRQTGGHALFTVELMRSMMERGMVAKDDDGIWEQKPGLDWLVLPSRTEGVIGERIDRVPEALREILDLASIEGEEFTAEVVAKVLEADRRQTIKSLSGELDKRHRLVEAVGIRRVDGRRLSHYRFRHVLFRKYLYEKLDEIERSYHHEEVGTALEELYAEASAEVAGQLALHFECADNPDKAVRYHLQAGEQALRLAAIPESFGHLHKGLKLLGSLAAGNERDGIELELRLAITPGLIALEGLGSEALEKNNLRIHELCARPGEDPRGTAILYRLWGFHFIRGHRKETLELAGQLAGLAQGLDDPALRAPADTAIGITHFFEGDLEGAAEPLARATDAFDAEDHGARIMTYGGDPSFDAWPYHAWFHLLTGRPRTGWSILEELTQRVKTLGNPFATAATYCFRAAQGCDLGSDPQRILESAERCVAVADEHGFPFWSAHGAAWAGWASVIAGEGAGGIERIEKGLEILDAIGVLVPKAAVLVHLADAQRELGRVDEGLANIERALAQSAASHDRFYDAEAQRVKGRLLRLQDGDGDGAASCFREAIRIANQQGARMFALRAATDLARLLVDAGNAAESARLLQPAFDGIDEESDSLHVTAASELLAELDG